jgi:hypothetical protein
MNNYVVIVLGWLLGQAAYACKKSWDIQRKNENTDFKNALKMHFSKETASFAFASIMLLIGLFVITDFVDLDVTKEDLKNTEAAKWKVYLINFLRTSTVLFGYICQNLGYFLFGRSEKILRERAAKEGVDTP